MENFRTGMICLNALVALTSLFSQSAVLRPLIGFFTIFVFVFHSILGARRRGFRLKCLFLPLLSLLCVLPHDINCRKSLQDLPLGEVDRIDGILYQDSQITKSGGTIFSVRANRVENPFISASASANLTVFVKDAHFRGVCGDRVEFYNVKKTDSDGFFFSDACSIRDRNRLSSFRASLLVLAEKRIMTLSNRFHLDKDVAARALAMRLLFARTAADAGDDAMRLASETGLVFVFALSGMHLNVIVSLLQKAICRLISRRWVKLISLAFATVYFLFASRSPSFVRAYIMLVLSFILRADPIVTLPISFAVQNIFFPYSVASFSFDCSYLATFGMIALSRPIGIIIRSCLGKGLAKLFSASVSASLLSALITLMRFGQFVPSSIILSPLAGFLAATMIFAALLLLVLPTSFMVSLFSRIAYRCMLTVLKVGSWISRDMGVMGYAVVILGVLILLVVVLLKREKAREACAGERLPNGVLVKG